MTSSSSTAPTRVVVTGLGVVTPLGSDVQLFWRRLVAGESGIGEITRFDHHDQRVHFAGEVEGFEPERFLDKRHIRRLDLFSRYAVGAAKLAAADADFDPADEAIRVGAVMASGVGGLQTLTSEIERMLEKGPERVNPLLVPMMIPNMAAANVSIELGIRGPVTATSTACAASSDAIGLASRFIRSGEADVVFAGGSEAPLCALGVAGFAAARALSTRNDDPEGASRPFDLHRDGFVMGEGAGCLVLESLEHAQARGAHVYAELAGMGMSADAFHMTQPDETGEAQARAVTLALAEAGLEPEDVDHVNAHGTSTGVGDIAETKALKVAFGEHAHKLAISSNKSMIGHCLGAAGAIEAVATVLSIVDGVVPPTINLTDPDPDCDLDYVPLTARRMTVDVAVSNSFGFGGHNVTLVFRRFDG